MTAEYIIREIQENAGKWLKIIEDPATVVAGILSNKVIKLQDQIKYLERRL
jgi:hypothetical protein